MKLKVELQDVNDADVLVFFDQQVDPEATAMAAFPSRGREAHMAHWAKMRADPGVVVRTVRADGAVAGNIGSWSAEGERLVGYWIGKAFWGKGVATEALRAFVRIDPVRPLLAHVAKQNVGSIRVLEKCAFVPLREEKGVALNGGEPVDEVVYALDL